MSPRGKLTLEDISSFLAKFAEKSKNMVYWLSSADFARIEFISPSYEAIWGRPRQTLYDEPELWITYLHPDDAKDHHPIHTMRDRVALLGAEARYDESYRIIRPDGEVRWIVDRGFPLMDEKGHCIGVTGVAVDATSEYKAKELAFEKEAVEKRAAYIKIAAGTIAHDLRTPLAGIRLVLSSTEPAIDKLIQSYQLACDNNINVPRIDESELKRVKIAAMISKNEIDFASSYINLILSNLNYDAIDNSNYKSYSIVSVVADALHTYPYRTGEKEKVHWDPKIDFLFWGNNFYLKNIINNLLKNSLYFIKEAERGEIFVWTVDQDDYSILCFKDTAKGASPDILARMFEGYYTTRDKGTGLGLAFCKSIMVSFDGDVTAESVEGEFIIFQLRFPKQSRQFKK